MATGTTIEETNGRTAARPATGGTQVIRIDGILIPEGARKHERDALREPIARSWRVEVSFCPFESEAQRDRAYQIWAKQFVASQSRWLSDDAASRATKPANSEKTTEIP